MAVASFRCTAITARSAGQPFQKDEHVIRRKAGEVAFAHVIDDGGEVMALGDAPFRHWAHAGFLRATGHQ
jgi:hypothetical protein